MRPLLTIAWFEFLMQVKSLRFKGLVLLIGLFNFGLSQDALINQSFAPREHVLSNQALCIYMAIAVFAGLFSMGRIRATGMQPILMTKPFHTITLLTGMLLGGLISLVILMFLILYPVPIALDIFTNAEVFYRPLLHIILFYLTPAACGILAITLWVRTCFKNNIAALIIVGGIAFGLLVLANSPFINAGNQYHYFTPFVSLFSNIYQKQIEAMQQSPGVSFTELNQWRHLGMNLLPSIVFLSLACYHLRRSEPQRKVLGRYGSHWYHTPTYLKIACDLKIDPSITWRSHLATMALIAFIGWAGYIPLISRLPWTVKASGWVKGQSAPTEDPVYLRGDLMHAGGLLPVIIHHSRQRLESERLETQLTFSIDLSTSIEKNDPATSTAATTTTTESLSNRYAELNPLQRERYLETWLSIENHDIPYERFNGNFFIKGEDLAPWADGEQHILEIKARHDPNVIINDWQGDLLRYATQGHNFVEVYQKTTGGDGLDRYVSSLFHKTDPWPIDLTIVLDPNAMLIEAPVEPTVEKSATQAAFHFALPPSGNTVTASITFAPNGNYSFIEYDRPDIKIKFAIPTNDLDIFNELLDLADPVIQEYCALRRIHVEEPFLIRLRNLQWMIRMVRWTHEVYRKRGMLHQHEERNFYKFLDQIERELLDEILMKSFKTDMAHQSHYDLYHFLKHNRYKGLNHRIAANHPFESEAHVPVTPAQTDPKPVFQMLYWTVEHEAFYDLIEQLRARMQTEAFNDALIREVANSVSDEPMDEFFDFWLPEDDGLEPKAIDLPAYKILTATADTLTTGAEETTIYKVRAEIENRGGGHLPVPVRLITTDQPIDGRIDLAGHATAVWEVTARHLPQAVAVDPDGWIKKADYWDDELNKRVSSPTLPVTINATK